MLEGIASEFTGATFPARPILCFLVSELAFSSTAVFGTAIESARRQSCPKLEPNFGHAKFPIIDGETNAIIAPWSISAGGQKLYGSAKLILLT